MAANDAAENAVRRLGQLVDEVPTVRIGSRESLGRAVGRGVAALVGLTDRELASRVVALGRGDIGSSSREETLG